MLFALAISRLEESGAKFRITSHSYTQYHLTFHFPHQRLTICMVRIVGEHHLEKHVFPIEFLASQQTILLSCIIRRSNVFATKQTFCHGNMAMKFQQRFLRLRM